MAQRHITRRQIARLNVRAAQLDGPWGPLMAAEMAALLRRCGAQKWGEHTLPALDALSNTVAFRQNTWVHDLEGDTLTHPSTMWPHGRRIMTLYTPSRQWLLVLTLTVGASAVRGSTAYEAVVSFAPEHDGSTRRMLDIHRHIPTTRDRDLITDPLICATRCRVNEATSTQTRTLYPRTATDEEIWAALVAFWCEHIGPITPVWELPPAPPRR